MKTQRWVKLISIVMDNECDPRDRDKITKDAGGLTKYGICQKYHPKLDIRNLTEEQAEQIYFDEYYIPSGADRVNDDELALNLFDSAVNPGIGWINTTVQRFVKVKVDGVIGPKTIEAINNYYDKKGLIALIKVSRKEYYKSQVKKIPKQADNLAGWLKRVDHLKIT